MTSSNNAQSQFGSLEDVNEEKLVAMAYWVSLGRPPMVTHCTLQGQAQVLGCVQGAQDSMRASGYRYQEEHQVPVL